MTIDDPIERSEWLDWRRQGIGASEVAAIMGRSPWATAWSVWATKCVDAVIERERNDEGTFAMRFGLHAEDFVASEWEDQTGLRVVERQRRAVHPAYSWARATLDGIVVDHEGADPMLDALGVFESKTTSDPPWDDVPQHYVDQTLWQMFVTDLEHAYLAVVHRPFGRPEPRTYEVERDDAAILVMRDAVESFWRDHVLTGVPPSVDDSQRTADAIREAFPPDPDRGHVDASLIGDAVESIGELVVLREQRKQLDAAIRRHEGIVRTALGDATDGYVDGQLAVTWRDQTAMRVDLAEMTSDHPDIVERYRRPQTSRVLRVKG